jgi:hypothetical protein
VRLYRVDLLDIIYIQLQRAIHQANNRQKGSHLEGWPQEKLEYKVAEEFNVSKYFDLLIF